MTKSTSFSLGDHFDEFIATQVKSGRYASASEVICAGLKELEDIEHRREPLRQLLEEGERSGIADYSYDSLMEELGNEMH